MVSIRFYWTYYLLFSSEMWFVDRLRSNYCWQSEMKSRVFSGMPEQMNPQRCVEASGRKHAEAFDDAKVFSGH